MLVEPGGPDQARGLAVDLHDHPPLGVTALVPGQASVLVEIDPALPEPELAAVVDELRQRVACLAAVAPHLVAGAARRLREIPVCYGGEYGPDLDEVAELTGLSAEEVVARHAGSALRVAFLGFAPGFAYIGDLPVDLAVPRLATPRTVTPAGSVALAGTLTGIYPAELPGGWRVIGRTPIALFDPRRDPPTYLGPGDAVRFRPMAPESFGTVAGAPPDW